MQHRRTHHRAALLAPLLAAAAAAPVAQAGPLADPTRPPAALVAVQPHGPGASAGAGPSLAPRSAAASAPATAPAAAPAPATASVPQPVLQAVLQSVQVPVRGPAVALVDGRLVKAGDMVGKRTVLSIDSQSLVLRGDSGTERLWLLAGNSKQAPGSIVTTHSASFVPAPQAPDTAREPDARARAEGGSAVPLQPGPGAALSLAGRTQP